VLRVPKVGTDRYYVAQLFDLFTFNFAYVGVRATGFEAGDYLIAGPGWKGRPRTASRTSCVRRRGSRAR
jgi:hypothetical protein